MGIFSRLKDSVKQAIGSSANHQQYAGHPNQQQHAQYYGNPPGHGAAPPGYPQGPYPPGAGGNANPQQWQQQQQQQYSGQPAYGVPPQGNAPGPGGYSHPAVQQGGYPQHGQQAPLQQHGAQPSAGAPGSGADFLPLLRSNLGKLIAVNRLEAFYPPQQLEAVLARLNNVDFRALASTWRMPVELAIDVAALALYDVIIMADDSTSMKYADNGERINDLNVILERVTEVATLFDHDGLSIRAINSTNAGDGIRTSAQAKQYIASLPFSGMTALGTAIERRILAPFLIKPIQQRTLKKPILVITITDGEPTNEPEKKIFQVVRDTKKLCAASQYGPNAVAFQFAQVGKDQEAQKFLGLLDNDPIIGGMVDATSYYELEAEEYAKKGVTLTPDLWLVKLMVGAIDPTYDEQD